jgi:hypothetical protein
VEARILRAPTGDCFRDIFASLPNVSSWPSAAEISDCLYGVSGFLLKQ